MSEAAQTLTVIIPLSVKPRGGRKAMVTPGMLALERRQDITLIKAVARAFRWRRMLESGRFATINELAAAEKINSSYVSRVLRLTLLAPSLVEAILDGRQAEGVALPGLMEPFPVVWERQCEALAGGQTGGAGGENDRERGGDCTAKVEGQQACHRKALRPRRAIPMRRRGSQGNHLGSLCSFALDSSHETGLGVDAAPAPRGAP